MIMNNEYKNLTESELEFADHYAETGNRTGLIEMMKLSQSRENELEERKHEQGFRNRNYE